MMGSKHEEKHTTVDDIVKDILNRFKTKKLKKQLYKELLENKEDYILGIMNKYSLWDRTDIEPMEFTYDIMSKLLKEVECDLDENIETNKISKIYIQYILGIKNS